jgi:hypothetical protein
VAVVVQGRAAYRAAVCQVQAAVLQAPRTYMPLRALLNTKAMLESAERDMAQRKTSCRRPFEEN